MAHHQPHLPIPPPLRGNETGTWAHSTITARMPEIARRVPAENDLTPAQIAGIGRLIADIPAGPIRPLTDTSAPDWSYWSDALAPFTGRDWLSIPWFVAETYFYRRIVEAVDYFRSGLDPFRYQKEQGLATGRESLRELMQVRSGFDGDSESEWGWEGKLSFLLVVALWGNQADLSLWPAGEEGQPAHQEEKVMAAHLLVDDRPAVMKHLETGREQQIHIILDNAGYELVTDLVLAAALLANPGAGVRGHVKMHPTFVSDAVAGDVAETIAALAGDEDEGVAVIGQRLQEAQATGRFTLAAHPFWTSPRPGWEMPADLRAELATAHLVISKGDANYRRLLGDRHWAATASFAEILAYFPAPLVALRTVKAQLIAGLQPGQAEATRRRDPDWMANGRWGMIQFTR